MSSEKVRAEIDKQGEANQDKGKLREIHRALGSNPPSRGPDVKELQDSINKQLNEWKLPGHVDEDGVFGKKTRRQTNRVLYLLGIDPQGEGAAGPNFTQQEQRYIRNPASRNEEQRDRGKARVKEAHDRLEQHDNGGGIAAIRAKIVEYAVWGCAHEPSIHYQQSRPIDNMSSPTSLPLYTDCSGFATLAYKFAGGPDPNGRGFDGLGYTGTILSACDHISPSNCKPGDLIVYGPGTGHHVVIAIEAGSNPMTVSHGQEAGPFRIRHSTEDGYQPEPDTFCRILDD